MKDYIGHATDWTGDSYLNPPWPGHTRNVNTITSIAVHHTADTRLHDYDDMAVTRQEAAYHYNNLGPGIMYHYKVTNLGDIIKLRPHEVWLYAVGSAENTSTINVVLDGNFENQQPTREQFEALYQLLENLCTQHPEFPATWPDVRSHNDYSATACCGANLRNRILAIQDQASAQAQLLNVGEFDWPELQPNVPSLPNTPAPTPPTVNIAYRVYKNDKQIGAYTVEINAWNKYKAEGDKITDQTGTDITAQLKVKYEPVKIPDPAPVDQTHDIIVENNNLLKQILKLLQDLIGKITGIFK